MYQVLLFKLRRHLCKESIHIKEISGRTQFSSAIIIIIIILLLIKNTYYSRAGPRIAMLV